MPKIMDLLGYKVYFWSNENDPLEPVHVHVDKTIHENSTKIWILKNGKCKLAHNKSNIPTNDLKKILKTLSTFSEDIIKEWEEFFDVKAKFKNFDELCL